MLLEGFRAGDASCAELLLERYKGLVRRKAFGMRLLGGDPDDLLQEGMIALFMAIRSYCPDREASFSTFAELLITRKLYSAVRTSLRKKNSPLNNSVSIDEALDTKAPLQDPEELLIAEESRRSFEEFVRTRLSPLEREVLTRSLTGIPTSRIAEELGKSPKTTDNALQRARQKLKRHWTP